jgi:hypothetical protein
VGITQLPEPVEPVQPGRPRWAARLTPRPASAFITGGAYALLLVLGLAEGLIGSFQYSRGAAGSVPLGAIGFDLLILVSCGLAAWGMGGMGGALATAIGWFVASFTLAMPNAGGSVIIAGTHAGEWFLYGGSLCALVGVASALIPAARRQPWRNRTAGGGVPPA